MNKIMELIKKYKSLIIYGIFGVLTTAVNIVCYMVCRKLVHYQVASVIAWVVSVLFAFVTNRKWVFNSKEDTVSGVMTELAKFASGRIITQLIDMAILAVFVEVFRYNDAVVKLCANVLVIVLNYIFSKFFVFKTEK